MSEEGLDEWDADFLNQYIQVEERALTNTQPPSLLPLLISQPLQQHQPPPLNLLPSSSHSNVTHSPPRELTQRTTNGISHSPPPPPPPPSAALPPSAVRPELDKQLEIDRLKEELGLVRQKLSHLEQECSELRERGKKEQHYKNVTSKNKKKDADVRNPESTHLSRGGRESGDIVLIQNEGSRRFQNAISSPDQPGCRIDIGASKSTSAGVRTDQTSAPTQAVPNADILAYDGLSKKLLAIWESPNEQELGRNLISNLLMACQTDFHFLFGFVGINISSKLRMDKVGDDSSSVAASQYHFDVSHTPEASKVSHVFSVLTKVKNGLLNLEALFQPLVNLCSLQNVIIVKASLHILHVFLKQLFSLERPFERRDTVIVKGLCCKNNRVNPHGFEGAKKGSYPDSLPLGMESSDSKTPRKNGVLNNGIATWLSRIDWISLFDVVLRTAIESTEHGVRLEAVSILNVIIMRSNAFLEREKFSQTLLFEILSRFLAKEAGFEVRKQAVHLLHMLLNCPKILVKFCSDYKAGKGAGANGAMDGNAGDALAYQTISMILQELADCIACCGNHLEELKLSRNAVLVLAFLASSGKSGFEILVCHELCQDANFLMLILQVLASDVDHKVAVHADRAQVFKERTLLIREALILLNRLVSNSAYSGIVLRLLTNSRDMASLTIEVANRLSRKDQISEKFSGIAMQMWESEIVDLARVFKKRVFTYLGDKIP